MSVKPVMTVAEVHKDLRRCGVNWSEQTIRSKIKSGKFPGDAFFTKNWRYHIFRSDYEAFKKEKKLTYIDGAAADKPDTPEERCIVHKYTQAVMEFEKSMKGVIP